MKGTFRETVVFVRGQNSEPSKAILLTFEFREDDSRWLADCMELGTAAYADTLPEAQAQLFDAVTLQLNEVDRLGFTNEFLSEHSVRIVSLSPSHSGQPWSPAPEEAMAV